MLLSNKWRNKAWPVVTSLLLCGAPYANAQTAARLDTRIRDFIVAVHPEYDTSDYRLSIHGQRMIGLNFPVNDWFFSLEPYPPAARLGYVYNPTSTPCQKYADSFPQGTCVEPSPNQTQPVLLGRVAFGANNSIAVEISSPDLSAKNEQFTASLPKETQTEQVEKLLVAAGAQFPPSKRAAFAAKLNKSNLERFLRATAKSQPRFCLLARYSSSSRSNYAAIYWLETFHAQNTTYLAVFEPFEGAMTVMLPIRDTKQIENACIK